MINVTQFKFRFILQPTLLFAAAVLLSACIEPSNSHTFGNSQAAAVGGPISTPLVSFSAESTTVTPNSSVRLNWSSDNTNSCTASGAWSGEKSTTGSELVGPLTEDTEYLLTCAGVGVGISVTQTVLVNVATPAAPALTLSADPTAIIYNGTSQLVWSTQNVENCSASGSWSDSQNTVGTYNTDPLTATSNFTLTCTGPGGSVTESVSVTVGAPPALTPTITLTAAPTSIAYGGSTTLTWSTENVSSCSATGAWSGNKSVSGNQSITDLDDDATYTLTCTGTGGTTSRSITVDVANPPSPTLSLSGNPTTVDYNENATLSWSSTDTTSCSASGAWSGSKGTVGSESTGSLTTGSSFSLSCSGPGGTISRSVYVTVNSPPPPTVSLNSSQTAVASGDQATLSWSATNANSCTASGAWQGSKSISGSESVGPLSSDSTFTLRCDGPGGTESHAVTVAIAPTPTVSLTANPQTVPDGGYTTISWTTSDASSCVASGEWSGTKSASGSETVGPMTAESEYSLTCTGTGGSTIQSTTVSLAQAARSVDVSWTPPTTRDDGSPLTDLDGFKIYYGTTSNSYTQTVTVNDPNSTSHIVDNLTPGTYYFSVTAFDSANNESAHSTEVSVLIN